MTQFSDLAPKVAKRLKKDEGFSEFPYRCTSGALSIGYGFNLDAGMTKEEASALLEIKMIRMIEALHKERPWLDEMMPSAICGIWNLTYQVGVNGILKFEKMWNCLASHDYHGAADEALDSRWAKQTPLRAKRVAAMLRKGDAEYTEYAG